MKLPHQMTDTHMKLVSLNHYDATEPIRYKPINFYSDLKKKNEKKNEKKKRKLYPQELVILKPT